MDVIRKNKSSKSILFIIGSLELGGAEQHLVQVILNLTNRGWRPEIFVLNLKGPLIEDLSSHKIVIHHSKKSSLRFKEMLFPSINSFISKVRAFLYLYILLVKGNYHVIHFFLPTAYVFGGITSVLSFTKPMIMSRRSLNNYQVNHYFIKIVERILHSRMKIICANSKAITHELIAEGATAEKLNLIYSGVDLARYINPGNRAEVRKKLGIEHNAFLILVVANLIPYKGHQDLLFALAKIKDHLPSPWKCLMVGRDDGIGLKLRQQAIDLDLVDHLLWLDSRRDVIDLQFAADIGILASHQEGFSNAVIEGMAASLPMIVSDAGGNPEAVENGVTGIVFKAKNIEQLADAIMEMSDEGVRLNFGHKGRKRVEEKFNLSTMIDQYEKMYHNL